MRTICLHLPIYPQTPDFSFTEIFSDHIHNCLQTKAQKIPKYLIAMSEKTYTSADYYEGAVPFELPYKEPSQRESIIYFIVGISAFTIAVLCCCFDWKHFLDLVRAYQPAYGIFHMCTTTALGLHIAWVCCRRLLLS